MRPGRVPAPARRAEPVQHGHARHHHARRAAAAAAGVHRREPHRGSQRPHPGPPGSDERAPLLPRLTEQTGISSGRYVERSRADAARRLLEVTGQPLDAVARQSGLGAPETLYRVFRRHWRISPGAGSKRR
ncbi:helix-turn-helix domain-containing protein [Micromonospora avicenniae]|uniref:helix-turn-helix domain-containing protein n=1 Tax=Micromonospora avicenniae TaxID=1198245 RepID=UPI00342D87B5